MRWLIQTWRESASPPAAVVTITPKPQQVTGWIIRPAADRADQEQTDLARILDRCPILRTVDRLVADFGGMLRDRRGQQLDAWISQAQTGEISPLPGFAAGLLKGYDAVRDGLTLAYSSGAIEGTVCKIKALKQQMFGRAGFDLLRHRILLGN